MARLDSISIPPKKLVQDLGSPPPQTQHKAISFFSNFLCKAAFFAIFISLFPLFPSQAPDFVNRTIVTRSWELLHLLLVGIAVSYGLFSRRNADQVAEKEVSYKADSPQSYMSRILQVSSVFDDDEAETPSGYDENKIQMWNSRYFREEPAVIATRNSSSHTIGISKPLLLPVRNLNSHVLEPEPTDSDEGIDVNSGSGLVSASEGRNEVAKFGKIADLDPLNLNKEPEESIVLPSPIPWRSRSGKMEVKDESGTLTPPSCFLPPPVIESDFGTFKPSSFCSPPARSNSTTSSPKKLSPSPSFSTEIRAKTGEDLRKKKSFSNSCPPAPPPPPPPPFGHKSPLNLDKNIVKSSFKDELKDFSRNGGREDLLSSNGLGTDASRLEMKLKNYVEVSSVGKSVRTVRTKEVGQGMVADEKRMSWSDHSSEKPSREKMQSPLTSTGKCQLELKTEFARKCVSSSDDSDSDDALESSDVEDLPKSSVEAKMDENEVDKKADEFIAKFREQIRLQRIASIKRSSGQRSIRSPE